MKKVTVYTMRGCPYCENAKALLKARQIKFDEILVELDDEKTWTRLEKKTRFKTMPQIFFGEDFIGGYKELLKLDKEGKLPEYS